MGVGEKIKTLRKAMGLTQTELGERVGVKKNAVSKWECGRVEDIPTSTIKALATLFDVPASYLIDDEKSEKAPAESGKRSISRNELKIALFRGREDISEAMVDEVLAFADLVALREEMKKLKE